MMENQKVMSPIYFEWRTLLIASLFVLSYNIYICFITQYICMYLYIKPYFCAFVLQDTQITSSFCQPAYVSIDRSQNLSINHDLSITRLLMRGVTMVCSSPITKLWRFPALFTADQREVNFDLIRSECIIHFWCNPTLFKIDVHAF